MQRFEDDQRPGSRRSGRAPLDVKLQLHFQSPLDRQAVYGQALRDLMSDFLMSIRDLHYHPRVNGDDGRAALELAAAADRMAREVSV